MANSRQAELAGYLQAEYIALTQLQADALATADGKLAAAARAFVETVSPAEILRL
jgi:Mg-chelatase subunit ChlD